MSDYKLVPVEPTAKMVEVAQEAYMPFGDMEMAIRMALLAAPTVQQPAPDVSGLVEALTMARETIASALRANAPDYFTTDADIARHVVIQRIDAALAAHRNQGGER